MDAGVCQQLVEGLEPADVTDLGDERGTGRGTDAGDGLQPARQLAVEQRGDAGVGRLDLPLQQVEAFQQQADLERHLRLELGHGDGIGGEVVQTLRLRGPRRR
jgi:hypothetical protein